MTRRDLTPAALWRRYRASRFYRWCQDAYDRIQYIGL